MLERVRQALQSVTASKDRRSTAQIKNDSREARGLLFLKCFHLFKYTRMASQGVHLRGELQENDPTERSIFLTKITACKIANVAWTGVVAEVDIFSKHLSAAV